MSMHPDPPQARCKTSLFKVFPDHIRRCPPLAPADAAPTGQRASMAGTRALRWLRHAYRCKRISRRTKRIAPELREAEDADAGGPPASVMHVTGDACRHALMG